MKQLNNRFRAVSWERLRDMLDAKFEAGLGAKFNDRLYDSLYDRLYARHDKIRGNYDRLRRQVW